MRPLYHPPIEEISVQGIVHALADPVRARILLQMTRSVQCQNCTAFANMDDSPLPKSTLSKHFAVLREAGLIRSVRRGVELHNQTRCDDLMPLFGPLVKAILEAYQAEIEAGTRRQSVEL